MFTLFNSFSLSVYIRLRPNPSCIEKRGRKSTLPLFHARDRGIVPIKRAMNIIIVHIFACLHVKVR